MTTLLGFCRGDFLYIELVFLYFLVSLIHYAYCLIYRNLVFKPAFYKFIVLGSLGLSPFIFWA